MSLFKGSSGKAGTRGPSGDPVRLFKPAPLFNESVVAPAEKYMFSPSFCSSFGIFLFDWSVCHLQGLKAHRGMKGDLGQKGDQVSH